MIRTGSRPSDGGRIRLLVSVAVLLAAACSALTLLGCSPAYVFEAALTEGKILWAREDIAGVLENPDTAATEREKLALVLRARSYAEEMTMTPGDSFLKYSRVDRDVLAWVLVACKRYAFDVYTWWFPIVGRVPYKGYFDREDAVQAAEQLAAEGYETSVRGTEAFSTLGWFNDPVLSTTLKHSESRIANTVIHEITHTTVWIPDHVDYNETLANFVGLTGAIQFLNEERERCGGDGNCVERVDRLLSESAEDLEISVRASETVMALYEGLKEMYARELPDDEKARLKQEIFQAVTGEFRSRFPKTRYLAAPNNAEILQIKLYLTNLKDFFALYDRCDRSWSRFFDVQRRIAKETEDGANPYQLLHAALSGECP